MTEPRSYTQADIRAQMAYMAEYGEPTDQEWNPITWEVGNPSTGGSEELTIFQPVNRVEDGGLATEGVTGYRWRLKVDVQNDSLWTTSVCIFSRFSQAKADALEFLYALDAPGWRRLAQFVRESTVAPDWD